jgi:hypothetical protein
VHDDVAVHIESGIRAAQKLFSSDLASSKKSIEKLSSDLKIALGRAEGAEQALASLRSDVQPKSSAAHAPCDAVPEPQASCCTVSKAESEKSAKAAPVAAPESRRRVLECAPALIVDGPAERPKRRPLSAVDVNAVATSQPSKVRKNELFPSILSVL